MGGGGSIVRERQYPLRLRRVSLVRVSRDNPPLARYLYRAISPMTTMYTLSMLLCRRIRFRALCALLASFRFSSLARILRMSASPSLLASGYHRSGFYRRADLGEKSLCSFALFPLLVRSLCARDCRALALPPIVFPVVDSVGYYTARVHGRVDICLPSLFVRPLKLFSSNVPRA